ncbi:MULTISPECIES: hypothetical protein [Streptomyces]|uniref:hypothetical protein n=1 Tax=Streptomyces TaxID=1883 RepID=UPI0006EB2E05|nr:MULTISPECIES: hypothetical protein [Streptomyces]MCF3120215.1 hypothetical protein [Streptomyces arenae]
MSAHKKSEQPRPTWQLTVGRQGLRVDAGRHLRLSMSLTLMGWIASAGGFVGASSHWNLFG